MILYAIKDWFSEWAHIGHRYDEPPPVMASVLVGLLAIGGAVVVASNFGGLRYATVNPIALAPLLLTALLFWKALREGAWRLAFLVIGDLVASAGVATLVVARLEMQQSMATRILTAFMMLSLLLGAFFYARAWAVLSWYADVHEQSRSRAADVRAVLSGPATGTELIVEVLSVREEVAEVELRDATGTRAASVNSELLSPALKPTSPQRRFFFVRGAELAEETEASGSYRGQRSRLRLKSVAESVFLGGSVQKESVSFVTEMIVSVVMLLLQHAVLGLAALLLAQAL